MAAFDVAAMVFLLSCAPLLGTREARVIRDHARANDANRHVLLAITGVVMAVLLTRSRPKPWATTRSRSPRV